MLTAPRGGHVAVAFIPLIRPRGIYYYNLYRLFPNS